MGQYPPPPNSPHGQEPTPPRSSKMYHQWNNQFDVNNQPSETSSPMDTPVHVAPEFYLEDRRTPGPPEPYMGHYGVSHPTEPHPITHTASPYYLDMSQIPNQSTMLLRGNASIPMEPQSRDLDRNFSQAAPTILHDAPRGSHHRRLTSDAGVKSERLPAESVRCPSDSSPKRPVLGNSRVKKTQSKKSSKGSIPKTFKEHQNCYGDEVPPSLKDNCPDEERCIFDSRWRHRNKRGEDMWDSIQSDFLQAFNKSHGKEMLQMKFKRARSKYLQWLPKDVRHTYLPPNITHAADSLRFNCKV